jgi:hypothetical protein
MPAAGVHMHTPGRNSTVFVDVARAKFSRVRQSVYVQQGFSVSVWWKAADC